MRRLLLGIGIVILLTWCIYLLHPHVANHPTSSITPTPSQFYCSVKDLSAVLSSEGAAGSTYVTAKLTNTTNHECVLHGNLFIDPQYNSQITNLTVVHDTPQPAPLLVIPSQGTTTALIHYNNGPQCNSDVKQTPSQFTYTLSNTEKIIFADTSGRKQFQIPTCSNTSEVSTIDITAFSLSK